jgi:glycine hydroxymethyltransferase
MLHKLVANSNDNLVTSILESLEGSKSLNLFPTENRMSVAALRAMASDAGHRYQFSEGVDCFYGDTGRLVEVIAQCRELACEYFSAKYAIVDHLSGLNTMHCVITAVAREGDVVYIMDPSSGGHYATAAICHGNHFRTHCIPFDRRSCDIDYGTFAEAARLIPADVVYLDISTLVRLPSMSAVRSAVGAKSVICLDASQILALVPNHPGKIGLESGLDVLNGSTHKTIPGPQKGIALTNNARVLGMLEARLPFLVSNPHINAIGALAITLAEMMVDRQAYAEAIVTNAQSLARHLHSRGFLVPGEAFGFTETQQIWIEPPSGPDAIAWGHKLRRANIRSTVVPLPSTGLPGLRLGVQELTRVGMKPQSMGQVAEILRMCLLEDESEEKTRLDVAEIVSEYTTLGFIN